MVSCQIRFLCHPQLLEYSLLQPLLPHTSIILSAIPSPFPACTSLPQARAGPLPAPSPLHCTPSDPVGKGFRRPTEGKGKKKRDDFLIPSDSRLTRAPPHPPQEAMAAPLHSRRPPPCTPGGRCPKVPARRGLPALPRPARRRSARRHVGSGSVSSSPTLTLGPPLAPDHQRQQHQPNGRGEGAESSSTSQPPRHGNGSAATAAPEAERERESAAPQSPCLTRAPRRRE